MALRTPIVLVGNIAKALDPADTVNGRVSLQPITQTDYDALAVAEVDVLYLICATPPSGAAVSWEQLTQAEYDAIVTPDPEMLYLILG